MEARNVITYGAPGTGKSFGVKKIAANKKFRVTFHPDSDYASFVGCFKPSTFKDASGALHIKYEFQRQQFLKAYIEAWKHPSEDCYLIIEELNRGNCAAIFGDLFQLLDRDAYGFSQYFINVSSEIEKELKKEFEGNLYYKYNILTVKQIIKTRSQTNPVVRDSNYPNSLPANLDLTEISDEKFDFSMMALPSNLYIKATMNTSDQSLYPMDMAFKRRWKWTKVCINTDAPEIASMKLLLNATEAYEKTWAKVLKSINNMIRNDLRSTDKQIGQFFIEPSELKEKDQIPMSVFRDKVLFYLFEDAYKDDDTFSKRLSNNLMMFTDLFKTGTNSNYQYNGRIITVDSYVEDCVKILDKISSF